MAGHRRLWMAAAAVVVAASLIAAGLAAWEWPSRRASREVRRALAAGRYDEAWGGVARWLRLRPRAAEAHYLRAKTAIALGRRRDIYDGLEQARALGYPEDRLAVLRALIDAQNGRLVRAQPVLDRAFVEAVEPDPMVDEALARVYLETYDFPRACTVLSRWARDAPRDARPPWWRAQANLRRNAEAKVIIDDYREALRRDPKLAEPRLGLAEVLLREHRNAEAAPEFRAYLALRPDSAAGHLGAGRNALGLGDLEGAAREIDRALELDPDDADAYNERANLDFRGGDIASALRRLDRAVALRPHDPAIRYSRRLALSRLGRHEEAAREQQAMDRLKADLDEVNDLQARLADSPRDVQLQGRIARWMFAHGYAQEGLSYARKILGDHPGQPEVCLMLADYYQGQGDWEQARLYRSQANRGTGPVAPRP